MHTALSRPFKFASFLPTALCSALFVQECEICTVAATSHYRFFYPLPIPLRLRHTQLRQIYLQVLRVRLAPEN